MSKSCQKVVKKLPKVVKKLSNSCQKVVKKLSPSDKHSNPKLEEPENLKEEVTKNRRVLDDEETRHP
jgi:hypothetical protein